MLSILLNLLQEFEAMLEESRDIKLGFRYGQARSLFEDDPRWKVISLLALAWPPISNLGNRSNNIPR